MSKRLPLLLFWGKAITPAFVKLRLVIPALTLFLLLSMELRLAAQSVVWRDSFKKGVESTPAQCANWRNFLSQLSGKDFVSVTISGTFDAQGKTMADPVAATQLATLLSTRTEGTVRSGGHSWTVTKCLLSVCADQTDSYGVALSYDGNTLSCDCQDRYAIRPEARSDGWGGVNVGSSCGAESQTMKLVFSSGVSIFVGGATTICDGAEVELTAVADLCTGTASYQWSNGATSRSITVNQPGSYSVTVTDSNGCGGTSETVVITSSDVAVDAGQDVNYCDEPVQLNATGLSSNESSTVVNTVCIYNAPGGHSDCTFTSDVCLEGADFVSSSSHSANVAFSNPVELRYHIYYSPFNLATFRFKLNDHELGSFNENIPTGACEGPNGQRFPRSFVFSDAQFKQYWIDGDMNKLSVDIETSEGGVYLAGITTDVVTSNETFAWSPVEGLTNALIRNPLAGPSATTVYTVTYTDANGCSATDQIEVKVNCENEAPVAVCKEVIVALEEGCETSIDAAAFDAGSTTSSGGALTFSTSPAGPYPVGVTEVTLTVTDAHGSSSTCATKITVTDPILPLITAPEDLIVQTDAGACSATLSLGAPQSSDNCAIKNVTHDQADEIFPVGETIVTWTAEDVHGNKQVATQKITVTNADPVINSVQATPSATAIGKRITLTTGFSDDNVVSATIDWGDSSAPERLNNPSKIFEASHFYGEAGFFTVTVTVTDHCGAAASQTYGPIVAYDNDASVQGDGWFDSEYGSYLKNPRISGKAQFHFDAKYKNGWSVPTGAVSFKFKAAKIEFKSTQVEWLIVKEDRAMLMASGKLNGSRNHSILISAVDEDDDNYHDHDHHWKKSKKGKKKRDQIRVKILDPSGRVIYDTQNGEPDDAIANKDLEGGSIDIKRSKRNVFEEKLEEVIDSYFGERSVTVYPNPFKDWLTVRYNAESHQDVAIQLIDLSGKVVASQVYPVSDNGYYLLDVPERAPTGIYVLVIKQGRRIDYLRLVRK